MKIGIVLRSERKKSIFQKVAIEEVAPEIIVAKIPFWEKEIAKASGLIKRAEKKLRRFGAEEIIYEKSLKETPFDLSQVFYKLAAQGTKILAKRFEAGEPFCLGIKQKIADFKVLYLIKELIYDAKNISIFTEDKENALKIQGQIMEEFGATVEIIPYDLYERDFVTVNLDENEIVIFGKVVCKDFVVKTENFGYDIDSLELFSLLNGNFKEAVIKSCLCGKNKLTLNEI